MNGQPAKVLRSTDVRRALSWVAKHRHGARNKTMILLSVKAGLRAGEIAQLTWAMVTGSNGEIGDFIELPGAVAKHGSGRRLPPHLHHQRRHARASRWGLVEGRSAPRWSPVNPDDRGLHRG